MLERDNADEYCYHDEGHELIDFPNTDVLHILSPHPLAGRCDTWEERCWSCKKQNLKFIDKATGQVANMDEVQAIRDAG